MELYEVLIFNNLIGFNPVGFIVASTSKSAMNKAVEQYGLDKSKIEIKEVKVEGYEIKLKKIK